MWLKRRGKGLTLAIALTAIGGASSCSSSPTEPVTLTGTWHMLTVDNGHQAAFDPYTGSFPTFITGALLEVFPGDSMHFTTYFSQFPAFPASDSTWHERFTIWPYTQVGDSLYEDSPRGPVPLGRINGQQLDMVIRYPIPPSEGFPFASHEYVFTK
jgi:hypothetical protein